MTARLAMMFLCFGLITEARGEGAQPPLREAGPPATAPSPHAAKESNGATEVDSAGRSLWWPSSSDDRARPLAAQGSVNQPATSSEPLLPFQRGVLFLPYLGMSLPLGDSSGSYTVGHNLGALIGVHVTPVFSLNTEISVDYMNPGPLATESQIDLALSPLFQSSNSRHLFVFGLKLGIFSFARAVVDDRGRADSYSAGGLMWGATMGGFIPVGPVAVGCLLKLTFRYLSKRCGEDGKDTLCHENEISGISPVSNTFDLSAAALF